MSTTQTTQKDIKAALKRLKHYTGLEVSIDRSSGEEMTLQSQRGPGVINLGYLVSADELYRTIHTILHVLDEMKKIVVVEQKQKEESKQKSKQAKRKERKNIIKRKNNKNKRKKRKGKRKEDNKGRQKQQQQEEMSLEERIEKGLITEEEAKEINDMLVNDMLDDTKYITRLRNDMTG